VSNPLDRKIEQLDHDQLIRCYFTRKRPGESLPRLTGDECGIFYIPRNEFFSFPKFVVWKEAFGFGFTVICEEDENRMLLSYFLHFFPKVLQDHFKVSQLTTEIVCDI
jgi:hypothetical protein